MLLPFIRRRLVASGQSFLIQNGNSKNATSRCFSNTTLCSMNNSINAKAMPNAKQLPEEADVVVIGGGSLGTSILYHLVNLGVDAVLLEKHQLTAGTTWHSAGMLWRLRPSDVDVQMHTYTRDLCLALEEETEIQSWTENGGLFIATNKERFSEYQRLAELGKFFNIESHVLAPTEIQAVHPLINVDDVYGGLYSPTDGTIDPTGFVMALARAAKKRAATGSNCIHENTAVTDILTQENTAANGQPVKHIQGVRTSTGQVVRTKMVVNCGGAWGAGIASMVGGNLPVLAMKHAFVVTETIPGMHGGLPNVRDHDLSIYLKAQGDAMAIGGYEQNPEFWDKVDPNFSFGLFDLDWDTFGQNLTGHLQRCPAIETVGIKSTVCGPESFTPDHKPLVGPQPGVRGMFNACGFNSMGMMLGGGMGREVATWITEGSPNLDLFSFDCSRFHPDAISDSTWIKDRTHESYAKTYSIVFPHDEALAGRNARTSALHKQLVERGCVHQARHGFERPGWFLPPNDDRVGEQAPLPYDYYGAYDEEGAWRLGECVGMEQIESIPPHSKHIYLELIEKELTFDWPKNWQYVEQECHAAREGVAIFDQSYFGKFFLRGPQAFDAVQYICGADMAKQVPGTVTYTPLCNARGGVEADLTVTCLPDDTGYYFAAGGNTATKDFEWISRVIEEKGFAATLIDASSDLTMISVQGPHSRSLLAPLVTSGHKLSEEEIPFSTCRQISIAGCDAMCLRLTFVGELGFELHVPSYDAPQVYAAIRQAGDEYERIHGIPVRDAGYRAIDSLSAEKNFRHWHADLANSDTPMEAGIGFTVLPKLKQTGANAPDFLGRAKLEERRALGLQRKLVCLVLDNEASNSQVPVLHGMETIWRDGECIGLIRSTAFGYTIGKTIAYGYVSRAPEEGKITKKWLETGTWQVGDRGQLHAATFYPSAPFDPKNIRVKGCYETEDAIAI